RSAVLVRRAPRGGGPRRRRRPRARGRLHARSRRDPRGQRGPPVRPPRGARDRGRGCARRALRAGARDRPRPQASRRAAGRVLGGDGRAMTNAYVGLGANLGDRERSIRRAAELIGASRLSSIVETEPWGYAQQPRFLNAVAEVETSLAPRPFLDHLLDVERRLGRERGGPRWGPRT